MLKRCNRLSNGFYALIHSELAAILDGDDIHINVWQMILLPPARDVLTKAKDCRLLLLLGHLSSSAVSSPSLWNVDSRIIDCLHARSRLGEIVWQIQIQLGAVSQ